MLQIELSDILTISFILVGIGLSAVLFYIVLILAKLNRTVRSISELVQVLTNYVWKPINMGKNIINKTEEIINKFKKKKDDK